MDSAVSASLQKIVMELQAAIGECVEAGSITLNINQGELQGWKVETHHRVIKLIDKRPNLQAQ